MTSVEHPPPGGTTFAGNPTFDATPSLSIDQGQINSRLNGGQFRQTQAIEIRGGLRFNYAAVNGKEPRTRWLPFYENPTIVETRKANYASTKIFLRNEPVRLFTGAEARKFKVDIHYTPVHIATMMPTDALFNLYAQDIPIAQGEMKAIKSYIRRLAYEDTNSKENPPTSFDSAYKEFSERSTVMDGPFGPLPDESDSQWNNMFMHVMYSQKRWREISSLLLYAMNHIRNSVMATASVTSPVKGPPIVELKWGAFQDMVPCIVTDYRLQAVENAGYDTKSLLPQRLKISLSLEEMRNVHGQLWGDPSVTGDLPGWDNVLDWGHNSPTGIRSKMTDEEQGTF